MPKRESDILAECRILVSARGGMSIRTNAGALHDKSGRTVRLATPGTADLIVCYKGRFIGVECKSPTGRVREDQKRWGDAVRRAGGVYAVVRSADELSSVLDAIEKGEKE